MHFLQHNKNQRQTDPSPLTKCVVKLKHNYNHFLGGLRTLDVGQVQAIIFVRGPHFTFSCVSRAGVQSKI
jgi:hypothetical protein